MLNAARGLHVCMRASNCIGSSAQVRSSQASLVLENALMNRRLAAGGASVAADGLACVDITHHI